MLWLALAFGAVGPLDPHPLRTAFRGPVVRLLDDARVADWLELSASQKTALAGVLKRVAAAEDASFKVDWLERQHRLRQQAAVRHREHLWAVNGAVGDRAAAQLAGLAYRHWGASAAFAAGVAERVGVGETQQQEYAALLRRQSEEAAKPTRKAAAFAENDKRPKTPAEILTPAQRDKLAALAPSPPDFPLDLYVEAEDARGGAGPAHDSTPALEPLRDERLLAMEETAIAIKLQGAGRGAVQRLAKATLAAEHAALQPVVENEPAAPRLERVAEVQSHFAEELAPKLDAARQLRLAQLRRQLTGLGGAFGDEGRKELGIAPGAAQTAFAAASAAVAKARKKDGSFDQRKAQADCDAALANQLTETQRQRWQELCGKPFDAGSLTRLRRAVERTEREDGR